MNRNSFAGIESKVHQDVDKHKFDFNKKQISSTKNNDLVLEIFNLFRKFLSSGYDGTGEWDWLQKNKQSKFINALLEKNTEVVSQFLTNMFKNEATYGYLSPSFSDALYAPEKVKSDILCNIDSCLEFSDITDITPLISRHGNPYGLDSGDHAILPDTPRHYYYSYNIFKLLDGKSAPDLFEIGGGYGGLCLQNWKRFEGNCTITNVDLFPALITAYFYLTKHGVPTNLVTSENSVVKKNMVNLISATDSHILLNLVPKSDLIFNSHSLCEMSEETILTYFKFINSCDVKYFYHDNSNYLLFPNSERHIEVIGDDFPIDKKKFNLKSKYITPFSGGNGRHREYIYQAF